MVVFTGRRDADGAAVFRNGRPLSWRRSLRLRNHSPTGLEWGYGGSGPAQLALALLLAVGLSPHRSQEIYQWFKWEVVARLAKDRWRLTSEDIMRYVAEWDRLHPMLPFDSDLPGNAKPSREALAGQ